jgi:hypothetical protein
MNQGSRPPRKPAAQAVQPSPLAAVPAMKNHHHNGPIHPTSREVIHTAIATKAYDLWESGGGLENQAEATWLEAERGLSAAPGENPSES